MYETTSCPNATEAARYEPILLEACGAVCVDIEQTVMLPQVASPQPTGDPVDDFLVGNEQWRGKVRTGTATTSAVTAAVRLVDEAAEAVRFCSPALYTIAEAAASLQDDETEKRKKGRKKATVMYDSLNRSVYVKLPSRVSVSKIMKALETHSSSISEVVTVRDRNGKIMEDCVSTAQIEAEIVTYRTATDGAVEVHPF